MRRKIQFEQGKFYHLCNKSNDGNTIFFDRRDYARMLFFMLFYQFSTPFLNIGRSVSYFTKHSRFNILSKRMEEIYPHRQVELVAFAIMPNHFHILAQEKEEKGIVKYLMRLQGGYAKYINTKRKQSGHVFQGNFRAVAVKTDPQLLYLSAYIHRNPRDLSKWRGKEISYPWSSYQDFAQKNRWEQLLVPTVVLNQFSKPHAYKKFVETSSAKLKKKKIDIRDLILE